jgi:hypothetical protein
LASEAGRHTVTASSDRAPAADTKASAPVSTTTEPTLELSMGDLRRNETVSDSIDKRPVDIGGHEPSSKAHEPSFSANELSSRA